SLSRLADEHLPVAIALRVERRSRRILRQGFSFLLALFLPPGDQLISDVILVNIRDVPDGFAPHARRGYDFHVVKPSIGIKPFSGGFPAQLSDAGGTAIVCREGEEHLV